MDEDWAKEKQLVQHQLKTYGEQLDSISKAVNDIKVQVAVLHTKVMFGAAGISVIISIIAKFINFGGTPS